MSLHIIRDYLKTKYYSADGPRYPVKDLIAGRRFKGGLAHCEELLDFIEPVPEYLGTRYYYETNISYRRKMCQQTKRRNRYFK